MKKLFGMLLALVMVLCMITTSFAAEKATSQVVNPGGVKYFKADGTETNNETFPGGDAVVKLSKKIAGTEKENEFIVTLEVSTTQEIEELQSDTPDAAVMLIIDVSNSMDDCDVCGQESSSHGFWTGHQYVSRLAKAKDAAIQFLDDFASKTGVQSGDKRYVAIVDFGSTAHRRLNWVDVTNASQMESAKAQIQNLTVAHSDLEDVWDNGGTNIEGALMLAANVWENNATAADVSYKYTILLTDGNPTFHVTEDNRNSTLTITGTAGGSNVTKYEDAKDVGTQANRILGLNGVSKLYSICFGDDVWDKKPFSDTKEWTNSRRSSANPKIENSSMTVGQWLKAFSTNAFNGEATDLFDTFNSVISQIQLAAQAWKVTDIMGTHVVYGDEVKQGTLNNRHSFDEETGMLTWNILQSDHSAFETKKVGNTEYSVLTYTYKYKITLDNLDKSYIPSNVGTAANNVAKLTFAVKDTDGLWKVRPDVVFPVPKVKGFTGKLSFDKVWMNDGTEEKLSGAEFTLTSKEKSAEGAVWSQKATSDANGKVEFTGIPSGHTYTLTETHPTEGFAAADSRDVVVSYGNTTCANLTGGKIVNEKTNKTVNLTLKKAFGSSDHPASILFTVTGPNYREPVLLNADNSWTVTLYGLTPGQYTISEDAEWPGYDLTSSVVINNGASQNMTHNNVVVNLVNDNMDSATSHTVTFNNTYKQQVGKVAMEKTFWEREHDDLINDAEQPDMIQLDKALYENIVVTITLQKGDQTHNVVLNESNNWSGSLENLPVGEYTILENRGNAAAIKIADHEFVHLHVTVDGQELEGNKITIGKDSNIGLNLENHYSHHMGDITVVKTLSGIEEADIPAGTTFLVDVYPAKDGVQDGTTPVTTIIVAKLEGGVWRGTSKDIPVGKYWLEERTPAAIPGYDFVRGAFDSQLVLVNNETTTTLANLTNTYQQQKGTLTVNKLFGSDEASQEAKNWLVNNNKSIYVNVLDENHSGNLVTYLELNEGNNWQASVELPLGKYYLAEKLDGTIDDNPDNHVLGSADVPNFSLIAHWTNNGVVEVKAPTNGVSNTYTATVTNTYSKDMHPVTVTKEFAGEYPNTANAEVFFAIYKLDETRATEHVATVRLNAEKNWTETIYLPAGTYYIYEYGAHDAFTNYTITKVTFNGNEWYKTGDNMASIEGYQFVIASNADTDDIITLAAVNTYTRDTGTLTIKKAFTGLTADQYEDLEIEVEVFKAGELFATVTLKKDNNWTYTLTGLDVDVTYTLSEKLKSAQVEGYNLSHSWENASVILEKNQTVTSTVTNTYTQKTGKLSLHKRFEGVQTDEMALLDGATVTVTITGNSEVKTVTLNNAGGWESEEIELPIGTYTLREDPVAINGYTHSDVGFAGTGVVDGGAGDNTARVTVADNAKVEVHLTNTMTRNTGKLKITKAFANDSDLKAANFANKSIDVLVKRNGVAYTTVTLNQGNDWSVTLENVPTDTYTVEEVTENTAVNSAAVKDYALEVTYSGNGTVTKDATAALTVTNKYTRHVGYIMVKKVFEKDTDSLAAEKFIPETGIAIRVLNSAGQHVTTLHVSRTKVITDPIALPVGTYTLQEVKEAGAEGTAYVDGYTLQSSWSENNGTATVTEGPVANAQTFTLNNKYTRNQGILTVEKAYVGLEDALKPEITVYVKQGEAVAATLTLTATNPKAEVKLPTGNYTVEEAEGTAAVTGYSLNVNYDKQNVSLTSAGDTVKITNTYSRDYGKLTVEKAYVGLEDALKPVITVYVKQGAAVVKTLEVTAPDWKVEVDLPTGNYTVEEVEGTAAVTGYNLNVNYDKQDVSLPSAGAAVKITNTYEQQKGTLTVNKLFDSGEASQEAKKWLEDNNKEIHVLVMDAVHGHHEVARLKLTGPDWTDSIELPLGTYHLSEVMAVGAEGTADVGDYGVVEHWDNNVVEITADNYSTVTFTRNVTNTYTRDRGSVHIQKVNAGVPTDLVPESMVAFHFFKKTNGSYAQTPDAIVTLPDTTQPQGQKWQKRVDLPTGTYLVKEFGAADLFENYTFDGMDWNKAAEVGNVAPASEGYELTVQENDTINLVANNHYTRDTGTLTIKKAFSGLTTDQYKDLEIEVEVFKAGNLFETVTLKKDNNWTDTLTGLDVGVTYTLSEKLESAQVEGYNMSHSWENASVILEKDQRVTSTVTNTYSRHYGMLTVEKAYVGLEDALKPEIMVYVKQGASVVKELKLNAANPRVEVELPTGDYTVVEDEGRAAVTGYGLNVSYDKQDVNLTSAGAAVKITNTYAQHVGNLTITKEFSGLPENVRPEMIQFTVQKVGGASQIVTLPDVDETPWSIALTNLPVGQYTVTEIAETAQVPGYTVTVPAGQTVNVTEGADVEAKVINQYEFIPVTGNLTITKAFAAGSALSGDHFDSIKVNVMKNGAVVQTVTLLKSEGWTKTIEVPFGTYTVVEDHASAAAPGYSLSVSYDKTEVTVSAAAGDAVTITNRYTYIPVTGSLNLTKAFQGPQYLYPTSVEFTVTGPAYSQKVTLSAENNWMVTLSGLVPGEYTVTETLTDGYSYDVQSIWSNADGKVQVQAGQMSTLKCTNVYTERPTMSVRIPVEKTVMLAGSIAPDQVFYFSFQAAWQGGPVVMRFENDPSNTAGIFQQTSANTYGVTVKGDGTVKGYIVLEGYTEDLLNGKLQTWEMLSGYATAEEALAAGWTFDKTATDGTVVWNVQLGHDGQGGIQARIARTDGQPTDQVSFLNVHTVPFDPPQTGDEENLLLWMALCGISAMCVLCLVRSKKNTSYQVK